MKSFKEYLNETAYGQVEEEMPVTTTPEAVSEDEFNDDPTVAGWYLVDTGNGQVCDGPFETSRLASERKSYSSESPQFWNGTEWTEDDTTRRMAQLAGIR